MIRQLHDAAPAYSAGEQLWRQGADAREIAARTGLSKVQAQRLCTRMLAARKRLDAMYRPESLTDAVVTSAIKRWVLRNGLPCTPRRWTDSVERGDETIPSVMLISKYGSWAKVMRMAGVPYERRGRSV